MARKRTAPIRRRLALEPLEGRRLLTAMPLGAEPVDTGEFMLGRVAVTPIFFESTGPASTEDWTEQEIQGVLQKIEDGMQWWVDTLDRLGSVHSLEFVYDLTYALEPFETTYEPIAETSNTNTRYVGEFLQARGLDTSLQMSEAIRLFNHQQRVALDADWGVSIVVVDASDDPDGAFAPGGTFATAFAYPGGQYMVVPSVRPAEVFAHELGHLFWANDEYSGGDPWTDRRGYYSTQNWNSADNPTPGFVQEISIMAGGTLRSRAYQQNVSAASTLAYVGWQDSDGDGIFDVADVPLELAGTAQLDAAAGRFDFTGFASAVALPNRNSLGRQNDITLNRVREVQIRIDDGPWTNLRAADLPTLDQQQVQLDLSIAVPSGADEVSIRVRDSATTVVSPAITATAQRPGTTSAAAAGYAFVDRDLDGNLDADETAASGVTARIVAAADGDLPPTGQVSAAALADGTELDNLSGWSVEAIANSSDGRVRAQAGPEPDSPARLAWYQAVTGRWIDRWSTYQQLHANFEHPTSEVEVSLIAASDQAVGRVEAFDDAGALVARATTETTAAGEATQLRITDPSESMTSIRVFGRDGAEWLIDGLRYGPSLVADGDGSGWFRFDHLPTGQYTVEVEPSLIVQQAAAPVMIDVEAGQSSTVNVPLISVDSPWRNAAMPADVDGNGDVEPYDALMVIAHLNRRGIGALPPTVDGLWVDVNNDGIASPVDALHVINQLNRESRNRGQGEAAPFGRTATTPGSSEALREHAIESFETSQQRVLGLPGKLPHQHVDLWMRVEATDTAGSEREFANRGGRGVEDSLDEGQLRAQITLD